MTCPHCASTATTERPDRTALGYCRFRCRSCNRGVNERTGTLFNHLQYPTDVICLVVLWRLQYKLSLRDLAEMFLQRSIVFTHEAVRDWEMKLAPLLTEALRKKRSGAVGNSWYVDETYINVQGQWRYLYRAIERDGNLVDVHLSDTRDLAAAEAFFHSAQTVTGVMPIRITTDGHDAVVYSKRAVNARGLVQAGLRAQNEPLSRPQMGQSSFHSAPHAGLLTQWASGG